MDNDDQPVGRVLSRREVLALFGAAGAAALAACTVPAATTGTPVATAAVLAPAATATVPVFETAAAGTATTNPATEAATTEAATAEAVALPACIVRPAQTEGPYFVDELLDRSDIRSDPAGGAETRSGVPLVLTVRVSQLSGAACATLAGATIDIWHCDADGVYSDVGNAVGQKFLRGYQVTDVNGAVTFTTIYPGWYQGRTAHIHFKIRTDQGAEFTSQLYFDDAVSDSIYALAPYNSRGQRTTRNAGDGVYRDGGDQLLLTLTTIEEGYAATFDVGLQTG